MPELHEDTINLVITSWRNKLKNATTDEERLEARCYIDAYQRVRLAHDLATLPQMEPGEDGRYT